MDQPAQDIQQGAITDAVPEPGAKPALRDLHWLAAYAARGLWELIRARIAFAGFSAREIARRNQLAQARISPAGPSDRAHIARIAYVLPRLSRRLPWRSDCLVQSMAGQSWLAARGIPSEILIGVERPEDGNFGAHAWLVHAGEAITGGEVERYATILGDDTSKR